MQFSIKELRVRHDKTQKEMSQIFGIAIGKWNGWEKDFGRVKLRDAIKVAEYFGVKLDDIKIFKQ